MNESDADGEKNEESATESRAAATMGEEVSLAATELVRRLAFASKSSTNRMDDDAKNKFGKVHVISRGETDVREMLKSRGGEKHPSRPISVVCIAYSMDNCQPCTNFSPKLEQMAREYENLHVMFLKCNVSTSVENRRLDGGVGVFPRVELLDGQTGRKLRVDDEAWDIRGANETKVREVLERCAYNVTKFDGLQRRVFDALRRCKSKCEGNEERFATLVKTVTAYASNAIEKQDPKYRRIRTSGKAFTERVKIVENGEECLRAFGFEKTRRRGDEDGGQDDEEAYEFSNVVFDEFHENNQFTKRELRRVIQLLKALTG